MAGEDTACGLCNMPDRFEDDMGDLKLIEELMRITAELAKSGDLVCPFCYERDFDLMGLKWHLLKYCDLFRDIDEIEKRRGSGCVSLKSK